MITTKRYDYIPFDRINVHPSLKNHRALNGAKVEHYAGDIMKNGLLEPLIVWERTHYEFYLVGGFHRQAAITTIREANPGYFDRVDVRVVAGSLDEMRALNLKLNADRLDARLTEYFDSVIFLNNANWTVEEIAGFLDKGERLIEDILRFAPGMDRRLREMLDKGKISWSKCQQICRKALAAEPGQERAVVDEELAKMVQEQKPMRRPITMQKAVKKLEEYAAKKPRAKYHVTSEDLLALLMLVKGKQFDDAHVERVRTVFPGLMED